MAIDIDSILNAIKNLPPIPPDPLNGATVLCCHPTKFDDTKRIADAAHRPIEVRSLPHMLPNMILGTKPSRQAFMPPEVVLIIGPEKSVAGVEP